MSATKQHLWANPRRASAVIAHLNKPGNEGLSNKQAARDLGTNEAYIRRAKATFKWGDTVKLDPKQIRLDGGTQPRATIDQAVVSEYAEAITGGAILPPVEVFYDGTNYWLADGFHRVLAAIFAKRRKVEANVQMGEQRDAILWAVGMNAAHGLRRTNEDKRRAVATLLMDEHWSQWSDRNIAERCKVSHTFVAILREEFSSGNRCQMEEPRTCERNGKSYSINVGGINAARTSEGPSVAVMDDPEPEYERDEVSEPTNDHTPMGYPTEPAAGPDPIEPGDAEAVDDARENALAAIEGYWPALASLLRTPPADAICTETLATIVLDLDEGA